MGGEGGRKRERMDEKREDGKFGEAWERGVGAGWGGVGRAGGRGKLVETG